VTTSCPRLTRAASTVSAIPLSSSAATEIRISRG
jgi:hypothetical protein